MTKWFYEKNIIAQENLQSEWQFKQLRVKSDMKKFFKLKKNWMNNIIYISRGSLFKKIQVISFEILSVPK